MYPNFNKTKIVATIGPASNTRERILELIVAGVDIFRLNFSHGTHEDHLKVIKIVRELNDQFNYNIGILVDLQGPKIRVDEMENGGFPIKKGDKLAIHTDTEILGTPGKVSCTYTALTQDVKSGDIILVDDGKIELRVNKITKSKVHTEVVHGGVLKSRKGMNLPRTKISAPSMTEKDHEDLLFALEHDAEWVALSFARRADDIRKVKEIIAEKGSRTLVIAKIERPEAIKNIDRIIDASDALMVARGDLGVEMRLEEVPMLQKMIVKKCNETATPVIIATQMMETMITNPRPTRAETNDVANAVLDGGDALMLSGETAVGQYPVQVIQSMVRTIRSVEQNAEEIYNKLHPLREDDIDYEGQSVVRTACSLAEETHARAIIGMTQSGYTAFRIASYRPKANIFIFTGNRPLLRTMNLIWGVRGYYYNKQESTDQTFEDTTEILRENGHALTGDRIIHTASMPIRGGLRTNMLKITKVEEGS